MIQAIGKGARTKETIVSEAMRVASVEGFAGLSIGDLARRLGMSKSGLFAHFGSMEELQKAVMDESARRFMNAVWQPAMTAPRGLPRIELIFKNWLHWMAVNPELPGGCLITTLSIEMDDKPGPVRDALAAMQSEWMATLARSAMLAIEQGHFREDLDCRRFAFEVDGIVLSLLMHQRLLRDKHALQMAIDSFRALIERSLAQGYRPAVAA